MSRRILRGFLHAGVCLMSNFYRDFLVIRVIELLNKNVIPAS